MFVSIALPVCARHVVMQETCLTLVSRITILPECMCSRAPHRWEGDIARNTYNGYNGCCEHLRFSACEMSSLSILKSSWDKRINGEGNRRDNRWMERDYFIIETLSQINTNLFNNSRIIMHLVNGIFDNIIRNYTYIQRYTD